MEETKFRTEAEDLVFLSHPPPGHLLAQALFQVLALQRMWLG